MNLALILAISEPSSVPGSAEVTASAQQGTSSLTGSVGDSFNCCSAGAGVEIVEPIWDTQCYMMVLCPAILCAECERCSLFLLTWRSPVVFVIASPDHVPVKMLKLQ